MSFVRCLRFELMLFNIHISILLQPVQWWFVKLLFNYSWESMRLIISPLAPPTGQSFFIRPFIYLSRGEKSLQILWDCPTVSQPLPLLTLKTIIREDKYAQSMHSYRKIASIPGTAILIRSTLSSQQLTGEPRSGACGQTAGWKPWHNRLHVLVSSWTLWGRSCSSGLLEPLFLSVSAAETK